MYRELLDRWCKANPHFYRSTYRFLGDGDRATTYGPPLALKKGDWLFAVVNVVRTANWRGYEQEAIAEGKTIEDWCKETLDKIASNDGFRQYFSLLDFKTIEELEVKLAMQGI